MKAILVVDIQVGLTQKRNVYKLENMIKTVNEAIDAYRKAKNLVVFIQHNNKILPHGMKDWEIDERIPQNKDDLTVQKKHGNAFKNTQLHTILQENQITELLVCGLTSHGCVKATCIGALEHGYVTSLLGNGHSNLNKDADRKISQTEQELKMKGVAII
jgi:nicotinamidase-related amidase